MASQRITIGIRVPHALFEAGSAALRAGVDAIVGSGIERLCMGDHVSFHGGRGFDGLVHATALAALCDLEIETSIYLLPLRHPVPVARQVNSLSQLAPGRFVFGVGIGGEDPNELRMCGIDPSTRGRRMDEAMSLVRALLDGETVTRAGGFYPVADAQILPVPSSRVPIVVGGRSDAALRRAGRLGDGHLALWVSAEQWARSIARVEQHAADSGRSDVAWRHGLLVWCGIGDSASARDPLAGAMEGLYHTSFEKFERWSPYGTPEDIATFLRAYVDSGCRDFNLIAVAATSEEAIAGVAEVGRLLRLG
jgi:alkanesulfonate monooxygenase SsuD/methylene tetrahydromethanopterin reductase-like flavin-dependent oxidoreductase (luciferase family)